MLSPKPSGVEAEKFEKWVDWTKNSLHNIMEYGQSNKGRQFPLEKMISKSIRDYKSGNELSVKTLAHILDFIENMEFLRVNDLSIFRSFRDKLSSGPAKQFEYLTGLWFETKIASLLIQKGIEFKCPSPDPPDFEVKINSQTISIECYCPRIKTASSIYPKLLTSLETRKVKKYRNQTWTTGGLAVLFLEGTWILRSQGDGILDARYSLPNDIRSTLRELEENSFYNLIVLLWFGRLTDCGQNGSTISCVYTPTMISDPHLLTFIDKLLDRFNIEPEIKIMLPDLPDDIS
ncbi:hypothetical protein [Algoriphagus terrigena]|uniref:hypothetical protein n=1 Tax=Algoriphagus terrigena TaxID=344884 RepID=UPI000405D7ED|nr:hypothetical protein [Algoriphagus terrigena]